MNIPIKNHDAILYHTISLIQSVALTQARSAVDAELSALCHTEPLLLTGSLQVPWEALKTREGTRGWLWRVKLQAWECISYFCTWVFLFTLRFCLFCLLIFFLSFFSFFLFFLFFLSFHQFSHGKVIAHQNSATNQATTYDLARSSSI